MGKIFVTLGEIRLSQKLSLETFSTFCQFNQHFSTIQFLPISIYQKIEPVSTKDTSNNTLVKKSIYNVGKIDTLIDEELIGNLRFDHITD
jgi:hypothetical protein